MKFVKKKIIEICDVFGENHLYTKRYCESNKGEIPVYSATIGQPFAFIDKADFDTENMLMVANYGDSGQTYVVNGKFSIGRNVTGLSIKKEYIHLIDFDYFRMVATKEFLENAKGLKQKNLNQKLVKDTQIEIPIDENGVFSILDQKKLVKTFLILENKLILLQNKANEIQNFIISDIEFGETTSIALQDIIDFDNCKTNGSWFTKTVINNNKGSIPVYGASKEFDDAGYGYVKDNLVIENKNSNKKLSVKYFENCLTWNIDGSLGLHYRKGRFCLSEKVIPLILHENMRDKIDLDFLRYSILNSPELYDFGFNNKSSKSKLKVIKINIPLTKSGDIDIYKQKLISEKYNEIDQIKEKIIYSINQLINTRIY